MSCDIGAVLEHYGVPIYSSRRHLNVLCPIHDDGRPSMSVDLDEDLFHCFACDKGGTALHLISEMEGISLDEAREFAASHGWTEGGTASGNGTVLSRPRSLYGTGFGSAGSADDRRLRTKYVPSWRRG